MLPLLASALLSITEPSARPVISVLYFENNSKNADLDVMRKGLADMIVTDLVAWDGVTVVEREKLESVLGELKLQKSKAFDPATAVKVGKLIGAQYMLNGKMALAGNELRLDATLVSVTSGAAQAAATATGDKDKIFDLEQELVLKLTSAIDWKLKDPGARKKAKAPDLDTLVAYSRAIDLSDQGKVDEASAAMTALVTKAPAFLMARERKQDLLKKLKEFEQRRKDATTESVLQLGKLADETLAKDFDKLDVKEQRRYLAMRVIKGRVLMRVVKQHLTWRNERLRLPLIGHEAQALGIMRAWVDNQRRYIAELERYLKAGTTFVNGSRIPPNTNNELDSETFRQVRDARFGNVDIDRDPVRALNAFILDGRADDGDDRDFTIAPALGDLDPKEQKQAFDELDKRIEAKLAEHAKADPAAQIQYEREIGNLLETKADALLRLDRDEDGIGALQRILDLFPSSADAPKVEKRIKQILGAEHDHTRSQMERWGKALTTCDDMDIRVGTETLRRKVVRMGRAGFAAHAAELEKACKRTPKNASAFAAVYQHNAMESATHEDCDGFRRWFTQYVEAGGSIGDMLGWQKNWTPWCELGDITSKVTWFTATLDENWTLELDRDQRSFVGQGGGKPWFGISARKDRGSLGSDFMTFNFDAETAACQRANWNKGGSLNLPGTCEVNFTKRATQKGEYDEGTFSATFDNPKGEFPAKVKLTNGKFRVRRE